MSASVGRNDPCPCGSGLKYKQCCEGKSRWMRGRRGWVLGALGLVVAGVVAWGLVRSQSRSTAPGGMGTPTAGAPGGVAPQPYSYDAATNRHFDPVHGHWHDGPPPPPEARGASSTPPASPGAVPIPGVAGAAGPAPIAGTAPSTPAPWTYDARKNQHWDPQHGHWHPGQPPAGSR